MVRIAFKPNQVWLESHRHIDFRDVSSVMVKTSVLPGDQIMKIAGVDLSLIGYNIALLEFAKGLFLAVRKAASAIGYAETHPLDADEHFRFRRHGEDLTVEADFSHEIARCSVRELEAAVRNNCIAVLEFFLTIHPEARRSQQLYNFFDIDELGADKLFADTAKPHHHG
jgi:hypothetical protein